MEGDISSAMGGSGSLAGDMPSLKSLLQVKWWSLYDIQCLRFLFYLFSSCNILSWRRNTMHPTLKICQMSTRGTLTRKGCIFGLRRTFGNRSSTNTPPWTLFASHARTSVTLKNWSWHSSRLLLHTNSNTNNRIANIFWWTFLFSRQFCPTPIYSTSKSVPNSSVITCSTRYLYS